MRGMNRVYLLVCFFILSALVIVGCQEEEGTPTPEFVLPSPTVTEAPATATPTWTPLPTPTTAPETAVEPTDPPVATATFPPTHTPVPQFIVEVVNGEDGLPVDGASVRLSLAGSGYLATYLTLANGKAYFTGLVPTADPYTLDVSAPGFRPISVETTLTGGLNELTVQLESGVVARIATEIANLRAGPGLTFDIVAEVPEGQVFPVIDVSDDGEWVQLVTPDGVQGWVFLSLVEIEGDLSQFDEEAGTPEAGSEGTPSGTPGPTASATIAVTATVQSGTEVTGTPAAVRPPRVAFNAQALYDNMIALQNTLVQIGGVLDRRTADVQIECEAYIPYYHQVITIQTYRNVPENWVRNHNLYVNSANNALDTNRAIYLQCLEGGGQISSFNFRNARNGIDFSLERLRIGILAAEEMLGINQPGPTETPTPTPESG